MDWFVGSRMKSQVQDVEFGSNDQPFVCNVPEWRQIFRNNGRPRIDRQTHSLRLNIDGEKGEDSIPDQTPTPTRFLKNCDGEGLFDELGENDNPFDREFITVTKQPDDIVIDTGLSRTVFKRSQSPMHSNMLNKEERSKLNSPLTRFFDAQKRNTGTRKAIPQFFTYPGNVVSKATPTPPEILHNTIAQSIPTRDIAYDVVTPTKTWESCSVAKRSKKENQEKQSNKNLGISSREILKSIKHCEKFQILKNMDVGKLKKVGPQLQYFATQKNLLLGHGSYGTSVYVGILQDGSEVAVKRVLREAADENEVAVLKRMDKTKSPYILSYRHFLEDKNFMYLILDLCEETLKEYVESHNILHLREEGPRMIKEILLGIKFLHDQGILHRDLKPSNILVDLKGQMKLADFGISRVLKENQTTVKTFAKGTQGWMAAEVIQAGNEERIGRYKKKSDIQSIGMIAFFILTGGQHPFGATLQDRMTNISKGNPVDLDALDYGDAKRFVTWLISHDLDNRPYAREALEHSFLQSIKRVEEF
ncbi:probable serine/threonine-protein kinase irlA isoform X2 [Dendronephthya gigantea]|uniref:probable serine/threonine-protein kinase irlA isoform X2 n=1 Tax=Dendronephthya gigantea TaxID=151771 RepID=UPI00106CE967|nr:probable serine/threonine-protein kinase irlA isoform X2 [Dendronephthya gigantea]